MTTAIGLRPEESVARFRAMAAGAIRRHFAPREPLTVSEWADKYRILPESSTAPGPFRSSVIPYARRWMDLLADPTVRMVVMCWAAQLGKSTVLENGMAYRICRMPSPMMLVRPKIEDAENWMKKRFNPMVRQTPQLASRVILKRSTSVDEDSATLRMKSFPGGFLLAASATSESEVSSWSSPFLELDEVDRMEPIPAAGHPVEIALARQGAAEVFLAALTSTPGFAEKSVIWPYLEEGTFERYHVPCPHCDHCQPLVWGGPNEPTGFKWTHGKPHGAEYLCASCAAMIPYHKLTDMLADGDWIPSNPEGTYPSSHLPGWYSPFGGSSWGQIAEEFERAHNKPTKLQAWVNQRKAECWSETVAKVEASDLEGRLEEGLKEGVVPAGVGLVTMGVDVQKGYLQYAAWGWGEGLQSWPIASGILEGEPETEPSLPSSVWARLDELVRAGFTHESGRPVPITCTFVDSGYATSQVYRYTARRVSLRVFASKGVGGEGPFVAKPSAQGKDRTLLFSIRVDKAKDEFLRNQILERTVGPGYVHLAAWQTPDEIGGLVSEERRRRPGPRGKIWFEWVPKANAPRNEPLDCRVYARAALESRGARTIARLGKLAEALAAPYTPPDSDGQAAAEPFTTAAPRAGARRRTRSSNFATDW